MISALIERVYRQFIIACFMLFFIGLILGAFVPWPLVWDWIKSLLS
jgi:Sec-independent protein secretion pathway component TatC